MTEFKTIDKRGQKEDPEQRPAFAPPASLFEEIVEIRITADKNFVHPSAGNVVVLEDSALDRVGRIIVPEKTKRRPTTGIILEVGKDVTDFQAGDRIVYGLYSGTVLTFKGWDPKTRINLRILSAGGEILARLDQETPELEGTGT